MGRPSRNHGLAAEAKRGCGRPSRAWLGVFFVPLRGSRLLTRPGCSAVRPGDALVRRDAARRQVDASKRQVGSAMRQLDAAGRQVDAARWHRLPRFVRLVGALSGSLTGARTKECATAQVCSCSTQRCPHLESNLGCRGHNATLTTKRHGHLLLRAAKRQLQSRF